GRNSESLPVLAHTVLVFDACADIDAVLPHADLFVVCDRFLALPTVSLLLGSGVHLDFSTFLKRDFFEGLEDSVFVDGSDAHGVTLSCIVALAPGAFESRA